MQTAKGDPVERRGETKPLDNGKETKAIKGVQQQYQQQPHNRRRRTVSAAASASAAATAVPAAAAAAAARREAAAATAAKGTTTATTETAAGVAPNVTKGNDGTSAHGKVFKGVPQSASASDLPWRPVASPPSLTAAHLSSTYNGHQGDRAVTSSFALGVLSLVNFPCPMHYYRPFKTGIPVAVQQQRRSSSASRDRGTTPAPAHASSMQNRNFSHSSILACSFHLTSFPSFLDDPSLQYFPCLTQQKGYSGHGPATASFPRCPVAARQPPPDT